ncbi:MAG TPA: metallophosphoesterase [Baekduia sp.]|nr:metallophosphoesterase [Baekduia sp.]
MLTIDVPFPQPPAVRRAAPVRLVLVLAFLLAAVPAAAHAATPSNGRLAYQADGSRDGLLYFSEPDGASEPSTLRAAAGAVAQPAFSPLGRRVAYASGGQVWVSDADGADAHRITEGSMPTGSPAWAPDGGALAFAGGSTGARDIYTIGADGDDFHRLTFGPYDEHSPAWSSRKRIAFVRRMPALNISRRNRRPDNDDIIVVRADGSHARRVTKAHANDEDPAWSPDGRRLAFTRRVGRDHDVFVMNAGGKHVRRLTKGADAADPTWSPDGRYIAYTDGKRGQRSLYVMGAATARPRRVSATAADVSAPDWLPKDPDPVIAAAGDIACDPGAPEFAQGLVNQCHQQQTSDLLMKMDLWSILALGDLQYSDGQYDKIMGSFDPSWGRLKRLIEPVIGNHDYRDPGATGLYDYFYGSGDDTRPAGTRGVGYYSFDVGAWHIIALDSDCSEPIGDPELTSCAAGSEQEQWLKADLAAHPAKCTLAYMHHPYVSSGAVTTNQAVRPLWQDLYDAGADVVLAGHDHAYERFTAQDPNQAPDAARGIRQFVVGTGGKSLQGKVSFLPNSVARDGSTFGVLKLTLHPESYDWEFVPDRTSGSFTDSGTALCH